MWNPTSHQILVSASTPLKEPHLMSGSRVTLQYKIKKQALIPSVCVIWIDTSQAHYEYIMEALAIWSFARNICDLVNWNMPSRRDYSPISRMACCIPYRSSYMCVPRIAWNSYPTPNRRTWTMLYKCFEEPQVSVQVNCRWIF